jgi:hypothetical protein
MTHYRMSNRLTEGSQTTRSVPHVTGGPCLSGTVQGFGEMHVVLGFLAAILRTTCTAKFAFIKRKMWSQKADTSTRIERALALQDLFGGLLSGIIPSPGLYLLRNLGAHLFERKCESRSAWRIQTAKRRFSLLPIRLSWHFPTQIVKFERCPRTRAHTTRLQVNA